MRLDPLLSLAFSVYQNKGVYALFLGSGVSRAAGIPTGWEIVLDLIRRVAALGGENPGEDPAEWYRQKYSEEPAYDDLLEQLGGTPAERNAILRSYIEPSPEERSQGQKVPQAAHKAIAQLARDGYFRLIITTNFDPLFEVALQDEGVTPDVISSDEHIRGARPLVHSRCTVLKVNGDYRDIRIRNTHIELAEYGPELNGYLDSAFDEFGLIVCGWSADYDEAVRRAILRSPSRRYTT